MDLRAKSTLNIQSTVTGSSPFTPDKFPLPLWLLFVYILKTFQATFCKVSPSLISSGENPETEGCAWSLPGHP